MLKYTKKRASITTATRKYVLGWCEWSKILGYAEMPKSFLVPTFYMPQVPSVCINSIYVQPACAINRLPYRIKH